MTQLWPPPFSDTVKMILSSKKILRFLKTPAGPVIFCLLFFLSTETLLQITSFIYRHQKNRIYPACSLDNAANLKIMCLGESTTYGDYPVFLAKELAPQNITVIDEGVPGADTTHIAQNLPKLYNRHKPDIALLMLGVNDLPENENDYVRLYAGVKPGWEQKLTNVCRTYAVARYLLWHFIFAKKTAPQQKTSPKPMQSYYGDYSLGTDVAFLNGRHRNITTKRAEKEIEAIQKVTIKTKDDCEEFLRDILLSEEIYPEIFFEAFAKVYDDYISKNTDEIKQRGLEFLAFAQTLKETKSNLRFQMLTEYSITLTYSGTDERIRKTLKLSPHDPYAMCLDTETKHNLMNAEITHPFDYIHLTSHMIHKQQYKEAAQIYKQAARRYPHLRWVLAQQANTALTLGGQQEQAKNLAPYLPQTQLQNLPEGIRGKDVPKITIKNYNAIVDFLLERGCMVICMQYPMRSVEVLKNIIKNKNRVFFVDNEAVFKNAVKDDGYASIFYDTFAGDFGHCTRRGNWFLAQNAAKTVVGILKNGH